MKIAIAKIIGFQQIYPQIRTKTTAIKTMYKISKLFEAVDKETKFYYEELRKIVSNYGEKDENGELIPTNDGLGVKIKKECIADCQKEINELNLLEVNLPDIAFTIEELEPLDLSFEDFEKFLPFIPFAQED